MSWTTAFLDKVQRWWVDHPGKQQGKMTIERTTEFLTQARSMVVSVAVLVTVVALAMIVIRQLTNNAVVVEPIKVPSSLLQKGYTPEVTTQWLLDEMLTIQRRAITRKTRRDLIPDASRLDFEMPGSGLSVKAMGRIIRESLGISEATVSGEIVQVEGGYRLHLRYVDASHFALVSPEPRESIDVLLGLGAEKAVEMISPFVLAAYFYRLGPTEHQRRIDELLDACIDNDTVDDDVWAYNLRGMSLAFRKEYELAIENYKLAIRRDPDFALALNNWGNALLNDGKYVEAAEKFEAAFAKDPKLTRAKVYGLFAQGIDSTANDKFREAAGKFEAAVAIDPDFADAHASWGKSLDLLREEDDVTADEAAALAIAAITHYEKAKDLDPDPARHQMLDQLIEELRRSVGPVQSDASTDSQR